MAENDTPSASWQRLSAAPMQLGESPRYAHGQLRWVDINARTLHVLTTDTLSLHGDTLSVTPAAIQCRSMPDQIACIIPTDEPSCWMGFGRIGIWYIRDDGQHTLLMPSPFDSTWQRFNDGCCDEWGRIWISSLIDDKRAPLGKLWCLTQGTLTEVLNNITTGNGMAYSATHRKLWLADTRERQIRRFDVDAIHTGAAHAMLVADGWRHTYSHGTERPDGACMLDEHHYAVAVIDGHRIDVFNIDHCDPVSSIDVPVTKPTMPCIIPKPSPTLVLTSANVASATAHKDTADAFSDDGFVLARRLPDEFSTSHIASRFYRR